MTLGQDKTTHVDEKRGHKLKGKSHRFWRQVVLV